MSRSMRSHLLVGAVLALAAVVGCRGQGGYPNRPITMIVPWTAGGGTDSVARILASLMEQDLGKPVNVVNRTGGSGVVGHQAIASAAPDGYTIGLVTVEISMMHHQGLTDLSGESFTPLGLVNLDVPAIQVRADAPWSSMQELIAAIREKPGALKASGTARGGIWHVALAGLLDDLGLPADAVVWVPSTSNAAGLLDLVAGGVDMVVGSHAEAQSLIDAGKVKSLVVFGDTPSTLYPDVPTARATLGTDWTVGTWRGIAAPKGLPVDLQARLEAAVDKAYNSPEYKEFMTNRGFGMRWGTPAEFAALMATTDSRMGEVMRKVGLSQ
jgi:putative tricarboxylic transport membrane protein